VSAEGPLAYHTINQQIIDGKNMTTTASTGAAACTNCIEEIQLWISRDAGANWFEVPFATQAQKRASRNNATTIKIRGVASNVCSAASKSWTYLVTLWVCKSAHWRNFFKDGDTFWARIVNGGDLATDCQEIAEVKLDDDGWTWDTESTTPEQAALNLEVQSEVFFQNFAEAGNKPAEAGTIDTTPVDGAGAAIPLA